MSQDPYKRKLVNLSSYVQKTSVEAIVVAVLRGKLSNRSLELIPQPSRAVRSGEVHEIIFTDEEAAPGSTVNRIAYAAFVEFKNGGVLLSGDEVLIEGELAGRLAGFDLSHFPNHMNVVIRGQLRSGEERNLSPGCSMVFRMGSTAEKEEWSS